MHPIWGPKILVSPGRVLLEGAGGGAGCRPPARAGSGARGGCRPGGRGIRAVAVDQVDTVSRKMRAGPREWAAAYFVDAESAYRFCPIHQWADWWLQCFMRRGFGEAYASNRFERISTLVAAAVADVQVNGPARTAIQREGRLEGGAEQCKSRYIQVYIDDFTGVALLDEVRLPAELEHAAQINPMHSAASGGTAAPTDLRAYAHALIAVHTLAEVGLHAARAKVVVGDPVTALGLQISRKEGVLRCPPGKRDLLVVEMRG
eukprot:109964-Pleurochrysis_carterae.AAC.1